MNKIEALIVIVFMLLFTTGLTYLAYYNEPMARYGFLGIIIFFVLCMLYLLLTNKLLKEDKKQ